MGDGGCARGEDTVKNLLHCRETDGSRPANLRKADGFTLLEVLLSLLLTGLLLMGVYNVFKSQEDSQIVVDQVAEMNQDLRVAAQWITRDLRMAGYHMEAGQATSGTGGGNPVVAVDVTDGGGTTPDTIAAMYADSRLQTTVTAVVGGAGVDLIVTATCPLGGSSGTACADGTNTCFCPNDLVLITDGQNSSIFCLTAVQDGSLTLNHDPGGGGCGAYNDIAGHGTFPGYGIGSRVFRLTRHVYSVDRTDPNRPVLRMADGINAAQDLVDYIEDLQVQRQDADCPGAGVWDNCSRYTVTLTARTRKPLTGIGGIRRKTATQIVNVRNIE
jgi:type IV pilus assembly protein PilW